MPSFLETYRKTHTHPMNRLTHTFGIPMVVISIVMMLCAWLLDIGNWKWGMGLFILGWILQFIGHAFEGKPPAFFSNPIYLIVGPVWWVLKIFGYKPKDDSSDS